MNARYDPDVRALYLRLEDAPVASSVEVGEDFVVDLGADSTIVGIEALYPPITKDQLAALADGFHFQDRLEEAWLAVVLEQPVLMIRTGSAVAFTTLYYGTWPVVAGASSAVVVVKDADDFALT